MQFFRAPLTLLAVFTLLLGGVYPGLVTLVAQVAFPSAAYGSLIERDGQVIGSRLLAQPFTSNMYFWPRPSVNAYDGTASGASNLSPGNPLQAELVHLRSESLKQAHANMEEQSIPTDLVTASASGLDPHISPEAAHYQAARVAQARKLDVQEVKILINEYTEAPQLGFFGQPRVNVVQLNLALDALNPSPNHDR